jgi:hypothetical protein
MCHGIRKCKKSVKESEQRRQNSHENSCVFSHGVASDAGKWSFLWFQAELKESAVGLLRVAQPVDEGIRKDGSAQSIFGNTRIGTGALR